MKKILFALYYMNVGGVEKAFLGLLDKLPRENLEVHVAFMVPEGEFMENLPPWVHIHAIRPFYSNIDFIRHPIRTIKNKLKRGQLGVFRLAVPFLISKFKGSKDYFCRYLLKDDDALGMEFDLAVEYASPHEYLDYYIARHIKARRRSNWIHFDVSRASTSRKSVLNNMSLSDRIFVVSKYGREIFDNKFPSLAHKTSTFTNIISSDAIKHESLLPSTYRAVKGTLNIVTVGRINVEKGQNLAIQALALLKQSGIKATLHLVGAGRNEDTCRQLAQTLGIADSVKFYGRQTNPYPYMAAADLYLQPSLHEGYCITLAEAKVFGMPIVATDFTGAREQLNERPNGVIATAFTPESIAEAIIRASQMPYCAGSDQSSDHDMAKLMELL